MKKEIKQSDINLGLKKDFKPFENNSPKSPRFNNKDRFKKMFEITVD
jgi:hypothetical protein